MRVFDLLTMEKFKVSSGTRELREVMAAVAALLGRPPGGETNWKDDEETLKTARSIVKVLQATTSLTSDKAKVRLLNELHASGTLASLKPAKPAVESWSVLYDQWLASLTCSEERKSELRGLKKHYAKFFAEAQINEVSVAMLETMVTTLLAKKRAAKTVKSYIANSRQFLEWAVSHGHLTTNPAKRIKPPKGVARRGKALDAKDARKLLAECKADWLQALAFVGLKTGLRRRNIERMVWAQVDLASRKIVFSATAMKALEEHAVPINAELLVWLTERKERLQPQPTDKVIGKVPAGESNNRSWKRALKAGGLAEYRVHDMRHTVATWLRQAGVEVDLAALVLAHKVVRGPMTLHYTSWPWEDVLNAVDKLPRLLGEESK